MAKLPRASKSRKLKVTIPEAGHTRVFVLCEKLMIYTVMGCDNIHHASNKATKLWGPNWTQLRFDQGFDRAYQFTPVKQFNQLLRTL